MIYYRIFLFKATQTSKEKYRQKRGISDRKNENFEGNFIIDFPWTYYEMLQNKNLKNQVLELFEGLKILFKVLQRACNVIETKNNL